MWRLFYFKALNEEDISVISAKNWGRNFSDDQSFIGAFYLGIFISSYPNPSDWNIYIFSNLYLGNFFRHPYVQYPRTNTSRRIRNHKLTLWIGWRRLEEMTFLHFPNSPGWSENLPLLLLFISTSSIMSSEGLSVTAQRTSIFWLNVNQFPVSMSAYNFILRWCHATVTRLHVYKKFNEMILGNLGMGQFRSLEKNITVESH